MFDMNGTVQEEQVHFYALYGLWYKLPEVYHDIKMSEAMIWDCRIELHRQMKLDKWQELAEFYHVILDLIFHNNFHLDHKAINSSYLQMSQVFQQSITYLDGGMVRRGRWTLFITAVTIAVVTWFSFGDKLTLLMSMTAWDEWKWREVGRGKGLSITLWRCNSHPLLLQFLFNTEMKV